MYGNARDSHPGHHASQLLPFHRQDCAVGGMFRPCFIQTEGGHLKNFRADINDQNGKKSTVEADRQFGTEKVVAHDDHKDQHAWNGKAVVHFFGYWPFPRGDLSARIVKNEITGGASFCVFVMQNT